MDSDGVVDRVVFNAIVIVTCELTDSQQDSRTFFCLSCSLRSCSQVLYSCFGRLVSLEKWFSTMRALRFLINSVSGP